jgi:hypothetical protein
MANEVIEGPPDPIEETEQGITTARNFDIIATSQIQARALLKAQKGVEIGAIIVWQDYKGQSWNDEVICRRITIEGRPHAPLPGGTGRYLVKAEYSSARQGEAFIEGPPVYLLGGSLENAAADVDAEGRPVANSADEPFETPLARLKANEVLTVIWWDQYDTLGALLEVIRPYRGAINSAPWQGAEPRTVLCHGIDYTDHAFMGIAPGAKHWWKLEGKFEYRRPLPLADFPGVKLKVRSGANWVDATDPVDPWVEIRPDRGRRIKGEVVDGVQRYEDVLSNNKPVDEPVYLDGAGQLLETSADQVALVFKQVKRELNFSDLDI